MTLAALASLLLARAHGLRPALKPTLQRQRGRPERRTQGGPGRAPGDVEASEGQLQARVRPGRRSHPGEDLSDPVTRPEALLALPDRTDFGIT